MPKRGRLQPSGEFLDTITRAGVSIDMDGTSRAGARETPGGGSIARTLGAASACGNADDC